MADDTTAAAAPSGPATTKPPLYKNLFFQVLVGIAAGVLVGALFPAFGERLSPLGEGFIKLIKMIIAPLIFCVVVTGIAKVGDMKAVGRIGLKALVYFEVVTTFALILGLVTANVVKPGAGLNVDPATLDAGAVEEQTEGAELPHATDFILSIIPESVVDAFAQNALLQVLLFSCLFAVALAAVGGEAHRSIITGIEHVTHVIFRIVGYVMRLAPLGAFGAMAFIIGQYGIESLATFGKLILACYAAALLFIGVLFVIARVFVGINLWHFLKYTREEFALALGTASSESVLPRIINKLENLGAAPAAVGFVIPTGYSFNLDGASIYLSLATVFIAQALGVELGLVEQLTIIGVLILSSKGMAGVPGSAFLALSATAAAVGAFPVAAVVLMLGPDRFMDSMRVATNLLGNCVATLVVARWEGLLDMDRMRKVLSGEIQVGDDVPSFEEELASRRADEGALVPAG